MNTLREAGLEDDNARDKISNVITESIFGFGAEVPVRIGRDIDKNTGDDRAREREEIGTGEIGRRGNQVGRGNVECDDVDRDTRRYLRLGDKHGCHIYIKAGTGVLCSLGIIYGYAYEGHCYKLPKPMIMYLPQTWDPIRQGDCGCDCGYVPELGYVVWSVDKLDRVLALDVRADEIKTLVLDENLPGNRSPLAYSQSQALAPQRPREY